MNWINIFVTIVDKTFKFDMHDAWDKTTQIVCNIDLDIDLWPTSNHFKGQIIAKIVTFGYE